MNKGRLVTGYIFLAGGFIIGYCAIKRTAEYPALFVALLIVAGILLIIGLTLSVGELVKSIVKRLKAAREREKAMRDTRRQARQNKKNSTPG